MATCLYPDDLVTQLDYKQLAATPAEVGMSPRAAAKFAKQLYAADAFTVGDYLGLTLEYCVTSMSPPLVERLNRYLKGCRGLSEHAAPGTCGGCTMSLHEPRCGS